MYCTVLSAAFRQCLYRAVGFVCINCVCQIGSTVLQYMACLWSVVMLCFSLATCVLHCIECSVQGVPLQSVGVVCINCLCQIVSTVLKCMACLWSVVMLCVSLATCKVACRYIISNIYNFQSSLHTHIQPPADPS